MNRRYVHAVLLGVCCLVVGPASWVGSARAAKVQPREVTLDNGLKLLLVERHEQPIVAAGVFYKVGSVNDPAGKSGVAHMFEHMLFKGSKIIGTTNHEAELPLIKQQDDLREKMIAEMNKMRRMKRLGQISDVLDPNQWTDEYKAFKKQYDELVETQRQHIVNNELANLYTSNGGMNNAGTSNDMTLYFAQLPANKLELFFWLESDRMANGVMREFYVERENVREERRLRTESTPTGKYDESFEALFWQTHPYGVPVLGWASEVESITRDDVREFYKVYYAPNNATAVIVGDFDTDETIAMARRYFERVPRGAKEPPALNTEEPAPVAQRRFTAEADTNPRVRMRYLTVAIGHSDEAALDVLGGLLSGKSGRLYKRLVTKEDVTIGQPYGANGSRKYAGHFEFNVVVKEGHAPEKVEGIVLEEIDKLREGEISDHELQKVKNQVLASSVARLRNNMGLMFQLGVYETWYTWNYINESPERMLQVTAADIHRVVEKYFNPKTRTVAFYLTKEGVKPPAQDPELQAALGDLPEQQQAGVRMMIKQIRESTKTEQLSKMAQKMEQALASGQAPAEQKAVTEYMVKVLKERVAELQATDKESN